MAPTTQPTDGRRAAATGDAGASLIEYALLLALIALVAFVAVGFLGESTSTGLDDAGSSIATASN